MLFSALLASIFSAMDEVSGTTEKDSSETVLDEMDPLGSDWSLLNWSFILDDDNSDNK